MLYQVTNLLKRGKILILILLAIVSFYTVYAQPAVIVQGVVYEDMNNDGIFTVDVDRVIPDAEVLYVDLLNQTGGITYANDNGMYVIPDAVRSWYHVQTPCGNQIGVSINLTEGEIGKDIRYKPCLYGHQNPPNVNEVLARYGIIFGSPLDVNMGPVEGVQWYEVRLPLIVKD